MEWAVLDWDWGCWSPLEIAWNAHIHRVNWQGKGCQKTCLDILKCSHMIKSLGTEPLISILSFLSLCICDFLDYTLWLEDKGYQVYLSYHDFIWSKHWVIKFPGTEQYRTVISMWQSTALQPNHCCAITDIIVVSVLNWENVLKKNRFSAIDSTNGEYGRTVAISSLQDCTAVQQPEHYNSLGCKVPFSKHFCAVCLL